VDTSVIAVSDVIAALSQKMNIDDLSVSSMGIEELVVDLYHRYQI